MTSVNEIGAVIARMSKKRRITLSTEANMNRSIFLILLACMPVFAQAVGDRWELAGADYKKYLSCNQRSANGLSLHWTREVFRIPGASDIEREGELAGQVLFEGGNYFSVLRWTKPVHDPRIGMLVMHMSAHDLRGRSTIRLNAEILVNEGRSGYGGGYQVYASKPSRAANGPEGALISPIVNVARYDSFQLRVSISNGGSCYDRAVDYHFRRVR